MKKMLSFLALAVFATAVQAVTLTWTTPSANPWAENVTSGYLVYSESNDMNAAVGVALGTLSNSAYLVVNGDYYSLELDANETNVIDTKPSHTVATSGYYFIIFADENKNYAATSVTAEQAAKAWVPLSGPIPEGSYTGPVTVADFTGTLVPEPTALALLALGVAGLALRRRA